MSNEQLASPEERWEDKWKKRLLKWAAILGIGALILAAL